MKTVGFFRSYATRVLRDRRPDDSRHHGLGDGLSAGLRRFELRLLPPVDLERDLIFSQGAIFPTIAGELLEVEKTWMELTGKLDQAGPRAVFGIAG